MPQGDKSAYTDKQVRMAEHIEKNYEQNGVSKDEAESRAWATVNKETGGGQKSDSGPGAHDSTDARRSKSRDQRSDAAKRGWITRRKRLP